MDEQLEAIGMRLRSECRKYATSPRKFKDLHLGIIIGLKQSLDMMGQAKYALLCIDEAIESLEGKARSKTGVEMMRRVVK